MGDDLYVSGHLGDARLALEAFRGTVSLPHHVFDLARLRMECPTPRIALGQALRGIANAMADISDGLIGDLGHILKASCVGAEIDTSVATALMQTGQLWSCPEDLAMACVLSGGDDYELVFSASPSAAEQVLMASKASATPVTRIGRITNSKRLVLLGVDGHPVNNSFQSFDHFA